MSASIFDDKNLKPNDKLLAEKLGDVYRLWENVKNHISSDFGQTTEEWKYYNTQSGWLLKTLLKKRTLFFFTPCDKFFRITFVFGDKAVAAVEKSDLPENIKTELRNARKYFELE